MWGRGGCDRWVGVASEVRDALRTPKQKSAKEQPHVIYMQLSQTEVIVLRVGGFTFTPLLRLPSSSHHILGDWSLPRAHFHLAHHVLRRTPFCPPHSSNTASAVATHHRTPILRLRTVSIHVRHSRAKRWKDRVTVISRHHSRDKARRLDNSVHCRKWGEVGRRRGSKVQGRREGHIRREWSIQQGQNLIDGISQGQG
jgi:hypothetical protein